MASVASISAVPVQAGRSPIVQRRGWLMFTLLRTISGKRILIEQLPALGAAWLIAERFYKFHSFSLECAAFLATWFVFDAGTQLVLYLLGGAMRKDPSRARL